MTYKRNYYDRFDPWENAVVENPEKYGKKEKMTDRDFDVCVICECVLVFNGNDVCYDCQKVDDE